MIRASDIKRLTAIFYGLSKGEMETPARAPRRKALPRQVAMALCRRYSRLSLPQIGARFNRDHTTVLYAIRAIDRRAVESPEFCAEIIQLCGQIEAGAITTPSVWAKKLDRIERPEVKAEIVAPLPDAAEPAPCCPGRIDPYASALRHAAGHFGHRALNAPSHRARELSGPHRLLLCGPDVFSSKGVAA